MSQKRVIPFFNYGAMYSSEGPEILSLIDEVLKRGAFILQKEVSELEQGILKFLGLKHAVGVGNCTDGLTLALRAVGIRPGDEIIFSSHTFVATAEAIHDVGAVPVPVECGPDHMMDPESARQAITPKTRVLMPTQLNGRVCNMDALSALAEQHGLMIIEDSAQALGAKFKGRPAGSFGKAGAFSFYPAKMLGCFGDGGIIVTNDDAIAERLFLLRDHGRNSKGEVVLWGTNSRLDNLQAAILNHKLSHYSQVIERRRGLASRYHRQLQNLDDIVLPPPPDAEGDYEDIYQNYEVEAGQREALRDFLNIRGVRTILQWGGKAVHQFPNLQLQAKLSFTEKVLSRSFLLPMNPYLSNEDVDYICDTIQEFYNQRF